MGSAATARYPCWEGRSPCHLCQDRQHHSQVTPLMRVARTKTTTSANAASWTYPSGYQRERLPVQYSQGVNGQPLKNKNFVMGSTSSGGLSVLYASATQAGIRRLSDRRIPPTATRVRIVGMRILIRLDDAAERKCSPAGADATHSDPRETRMRPRSTAATCYAAAPSQTKTCLV